MQHYNVVLQNDMYEIIDNFRATKKNIKELIINRILTEEWVLFPGDRILIEQSKHRIDK